ncbi:MAG TPA: GspE/PulE family protein [Candidatus Paceibacterota bacterium]|jgi:type IV pilus assembly protein PilB|nr:GspE/PulE family protein [Candidatus Paceibacterota bacterium]
MGFLDVLIKKGLLKEGNISEIEREANENSRSLESVLISKGVGPKDILESKGEYFSIPVKTLGNKKVPFKILKMIPESSAIHYKFVPIGMTDGVLEVGVVDPDNIEARDALQFISSKNKIPYKIFLISELDFGNTIDTYKGLHGEVSKALTELETEISESEARKGEEVGKEVKTKLIEDAPASKIVATILRYATEGKASDVHIEPMDENVRVRFRVDGEMSTSLVLPKNVLDPVVARIKVLSNMRLDEKRKPQDGRFLAHISGRKIDFRVSTFPTYYGEKVVMRILDSEKGVLGLDNIGLSKRNLDLIKDAIKRPYGMILISGPTGSGKTTTLYSMLQELNREKKNVLSLEDPIEYNIEGVSQSQVKPKIGYTFATGLRTTLRQDPDIIMVGEIRDKETAALAVQAALTGHLVLSTIHTNNAVGVIPRLVDMGIDPFLITPTLILAIAQRLVSTLCVDTGKERELDASLKAMLDKQFADLPVGFKKEVNAIKSVYELEPTGSCPTGTRGRMAVVEVLKMDRDLEKTILTNPIEQEIKSQARKQGMLTMLEDAILKSSQKLVPFKEVNKLRAGTDDIIV